MIEQEIASIMAFVQEKAGAPMPYYNEVPEGFIVPAVYFPVPEIVSSGDTMASYALEYTWYIKFFHNTPLLAQTLTLPVLAAIQAGRNLIPLIDTEGNQTGKGFRIRDPIMKAIDNETGVVQLQLTWKSPRPYATPETEKMMVYDLEMHARGAYYAAKGVVKQINQDRQGGL